MWFKKFTVHLLRTEKFPFQLETFGFLSDACCRVKSRTAAYWWSVLSVNNEQYYNEIDSQRNFDRLLRPTDSKNKKVSYFKQIARQHLWWPCKIFFTRSLITMQNMVLASHTVCVPKILETLGPHPWDGYVAVPIETRSYPRIWRSHSPVYFVATPRKHEAWVAAGNKLLPYVCYHTKFRRSRSNHVGERIGPKMGTLLP